MKLDGSKLRDKEARGTVSIAIGGGWSEVEGCFKGDRGWVGVGAGYV